MPDKDPTLGGDPQGKPASGNGPSGQPNAGTPPPTPPPSLKLKFGGKDIDVPTGGRAEELAQKGLLLEKREGQLKHREEADRLLAAMDADPVLRSAVMTAANDPSRVVAALELHRVGQKPAAPAGDDDGAGDNPPAKPAARAADDPLLSRIDKLTSTVEKMTAKDDQRELDQAVDREIGRHPWVKGNKAAEAQVRTNVMRAINSGERATVSELVLAEASAQRELIEGANQQRLEESERKKNLRTFDPMRGSPVLTTPKKMTAKSFDNGELLAGAIQRGKEFFGDDFK